MRDMGEVQLPLGMQITCDSENDPVCVSLESYRFVLGRFGMGHCEPVSTPEFGPELSMKQPEEILLNEEET